MNLKPTDPHPPIEELSWWATYGDLVIIMLVIYYGFLVWKIHDGEFRHDGYFALIFLIPFSYWIGSLCVWVADLIDEMKWIFK